MSNSDNRSNLNQSGNTNPAPTPRPSIVIVSEGTNQVNQKPSNTKKTR